ncbi:hypothetical protein VPH35_135065 [Triticum aestivum]
MEDCGLEFLLDAVDRFTLREEFAVSLYHPDPVPLAFLPESLANGGGPADSNNGSGSGQQICSAVHEITNRIVRLRPDASPTRSGQSTDRVNPQAPGWTKRSESQTLSL